MTEFATQTQTDGTFRLMLDGSMSIYNAVDIKNRLMAAVNQSPVLELDLSNVTEMDTAGFQLLVLAKRESQHANRQLRIVAHSDAVREIIEFYGMTGFFGDPMVIPAKERTSL